MSIADAASGCAATMLGLLHSFRKHLHKGSPVSLPSSQKNLLQPPFKFPCSPFHPSSIYFNSPTSKYPFFPLAVSPLITTLCPSSAIIPPPKAKHRSSLERDAIALKEKKGVQALTSDQRINGEEASRKSIREVLPKRQGEETKHRSSRKVNIRCRLGGKLMPRLSDGALHYAGGRTRITDFRRDTTLQELYCKMEDINGGPVSICYKLPDQSLDGLVSISSAQDLNNMLDKYDHLKENSSCEYPRLHVFLFTLSTNRENSLDDFNDAACNGSGLSYTKEVNGVTKADGFKSYKNDDQEGITTSMLNVDDKGDGNGNDNTSMPEHSRFLAHSGINDETHVAPQIINQPNDMPYVLSTYENHHHNITRSSFAMAQKSQSQNHRLFGKNFLEISASNSILKNQDTRNVAGPSNIDSYFGRLRHTQGNANTSMLKHRRFLARSNIDDEINVAPQIINPSNDVAYVSPTYEEAHQIHNITRSSFAMTHEPQSQNYQSCEEIFDIELSPSNSVLKNQDPYNVAGPSNIDSYFGHLRHTRDMGTYEEDENLCNIVELVESVLQSP